MSIIEPNPDSLKRRLSIIAALIPRGAWPAEYFHPIRQWVECLLASVSEREDVEILLIEDTNSSLGITHVEEVFRDFIASGFVKTFRVARSGDPAKLWNAGAEKSTGHWLHFLRPPEFGWVHSIPSLLGSLEGNDWIAKLRPESKALPLDLLTTLPQGNPWVSGSHVYKRDLFMECKGFPEGYRGSPVPKRIPGDAEFELAIKTYLHLRKKSSLDRVQFTESQNRKTKARIETALEKVSLSRMVLAAPKSKWIPWVKSIAQGDAMKSASSRKKK